MTRVKKIITTSVLVLILLASSLLLMACGQPVTATDSCALVNTLLSVYKNKELSGMFVEGNIKGIQTNFYLDIFKSKDSTGNLIVDSENHLAFVAIGMNYIEKNINKIDGIEAECDFQGFNDKVFEMSDAYNNLFIEYYNLKNLDSTADKDIYNGYYARYKEYSKYFIDEVYEVAVELGEILIEINGNGVGASDMTSDNFNTYLDYNILRISEDYKNLFINSGKGKTFSTGFAYEAQENLNEYCANMFNTQANVSLNKEKSVEVVELCEAVNHDRENARKALEEISIYDFYTTYDCSIEAYAKNNENAQIYFANLENYFENDGLLAKLYDYISAL